MSEHNPMYDIPDEDELGSLSYRELQQVASDLPLDGGKDNEGLEQDLNRLREGGIPIKCPRDECGYVWVYQGGKDPRWGRATCPVCGTTARIDRNRLDD